MEQAPACEGSSRSVTTFSRTVAKAARWSMINTVVLRIGSFASGVILARFYFSPREWGLYAVGLVVVNVMLSLNELGVSLALVRWDGDIKRFAPTVLTLSTASSTALYVVLYLLAPSVAHGLGSDDATGLLRVLCLVVIIDGIACVPIGKLTRDFVQGKRLIVDVVNFVISTGVTIGLAAAGVGAISFAWGALAGNLSALIGFSLSAPGMLKFGWDRAIARQLIVFGLPLAGASLLALGIVNVDSIVVGSMLGPVALGFYQMAFNMSSWPVRMVSETARRVSFAGFSRLAESPAELVKGFYRALGVLMAAAVPICVLISVFAEPLIRTLYGDKWTPAATALRFLAILGVLRCAYELAYDCLATSKRRSLMATQAWWLLTLIPALVLGAHLAGIEGVGAGHVVVALFLVAPVFLFALGKLGIRTGGVLAACARPFGGGVLMAGVAWLGLHFLGTGLLWVALSSVVALAVYVPFVLSIFRGSRPEPATPDDHTGQPAEHPPVLSQLTPELTGELTP